MCQILCNVDLLLAYTTTTVILEIPALSSLELDSQNCQQCYFFLSQNINICESRYLMEVERF